MVRFPWQFLVPRLLFFVAVGCFFCSCSLTYVQEEPQVSHVPEFTFSDAEYRSYEDGKVSMALKTSRLEQYQDDAAFYGRDVSFATYNKEGELSAEGSCQMISADTSGKLYSLLGNVVIDSLEEDMVVSTQSLSWNGKTEQLVTDSNESIELVRGRRSWNEPAGTDGKSAATGDGSDGGAESRSGGGEGGAEPGQTESEGRAQTRIEMTGSGFSASGLSMSFQFEGEVAGTIYTRTQEAER